MAGSLIVGATGQSPRPAANMLINGHFRSLQGWGGDTAKATLRLDDTRGWVCRLTCANGSPVTISQSPAVPTGTVVRGWARGDGTISPRINIGGTGEIEFDGTSSTAWQRIDVAVDADGTSFALTTSGSEAAGLWVEFAALELIPPEGSKVLVPIGV